MTQETDNKNWTIPTVGETDNWGEVLNAFFNDELDADFSNLESTVDGKADSTHASQHEKGGADALTQFGDTTHDSATINGRDVAPDTDQTVTVPGDFSTIQGAVDAVVGLILQYGSVTIDVSNGTYDEDVIIPPFLSEGDRSEGSLPDSTLQIRGDEGSPSNVQVSSLTALNCHGRANPIVRGIEFTGSNPYSASDYAVESYGAQDLSVRSCSFASSVVNGARAYRGGLDIRETNATNTGNFVEAKRGGYVVSQQNTGSADSIAYLGAGGFIHVLSTDNVSGDRSNNRGILQDDSQGIIEWPDESTHQFHDLVVDNTELSETVDAAFWYKTVDGQARRVTQSETLATGIAGDNTAHDLISYSERRHGLYLVMGSAQGSADRFTDLVLLADRISLTTASSAERGAPGARTYSNDSGNVTIAIDDSGATYDAVVAVIGGRPYV